MYSLNNKTLAQLIFQERGVSCVYFELSQLSLVRTHDPATGHAQVSTQWPFGVWEKKTPPSDCVVSPFLNVQKPARNDDYCTFFRSHFPGLPTPPMPQTNLLLYSLSVKYLKPLSFLGGRSETCFPVSSLGDLVDKPSLCCKPWHLRVLACCALGKRNLVQKHCHLIINKCANVLKLIVSLNTYSIYPYCGKKSNINCIYFNSYSHV